MKIATWNVNSIKARLDAVTRWLDDASPDVVLLQELKTTENDFPADAIAKAGYHALVHGQRSYNGVAILTREPATVITRALPGDTADEQARYIEAKVGDIRVAAIYLPNGNPIDTDKFRYKLDWMARLKDHAAHLLDTEEAVVLGGDYNVIPEPRDAHDPEDYRDDALFQPESIAAFRSIVHLGYTDALRAMNDGHDVYTYWDYQGGAWQRNAGIRIDHFLLSPEATDRMTSCSVDRTPRGWQKASDHTPVVLELDGWRQSDVPA